MADESTWVQGKIAVDVKYDMQEIGGREGRKERRRMDIEGKTRGDVENESGTGLG